MNAATSTRWWFVAGLAFVVSMANSVQARVNGAASSYLDNAVIAAMMSVGGGFIVSTVLLLIFRRSRLGVAKLFGPDARSSIKPWQYFAGFGGGIFIFGQALVVPAYGVSLYIIAVVTGQMVASLWVDRAGLGPAGRQTITALRVIAAVLAVAGVVVSAFGRETESGIGVAAVLYGLFAGVATAIQYALNGRIGRAVSSALVTSSLNFAMGFSLLAVFLAVNTLLLGHPIVAPPDLWERPELWLGGPLGMLFIASATLFVRYLGVLIFAVVSVLGQLVGALILDAVYPTEGAQLSPLLVVGLLIVAAGVVLGGLGQQGEKSGS